MERNFINGMTTGSFNVGLSAIIGLTVSESQKYVQFKILAGGGTLLVGGDGMTFGQGYQVPTTPIEIYNYAGTLKFAAVGATMSVSYIKGISP